MTVASLLLARASGRMTDASLHSDIVDEDEFDDDDFGSSVQLVNRRVQPYMEMLEAWVREKHGAQHASVSAREDAISATMRAIALNFMNDAQQGRDAIVRVKLLLLLPQIPQFYYCCKFPNFPIWSYFNSTSSEIIFGILTLISIILQFDVSASYDRHAMYVLQGVILTLLGIDILFTAFFSYISIRQTVKQESHIEGDTRMKFEAALQVVPLPLMWLLLMVGWACSRNTFGEDLGADWQSVGLIILPGLIILRWKSITQALMAFMCSIYFATYVLQLFVFLLLTSSAMSCLLLQGKYETGDFYTDNQYSDFSTSITTMFIFLSSGENYVESVSPALAITKWYQLFFMVSIHCFTRRPSV